MRKSPSSTGGRLLRAGIASAAATVVVLAAAASPVYAVVNFTVAPTSGGLGGGTTITASATGVLTGITTPGARVVASTATCATSYGTTSAANPVVTVSKTDDNTASITAPVLNLGAYKFCLYAGTTGTSALAGSATNNFTVVAAAPTLAPAVGPTTSGITVTATGAAPYLTAATTVGATYSTAACPATYTPSGNNIVATAARTSPTVATITAPAGLTAPNVYNVCVYGGTISGTSALFGSASYTALPALSLSQNSGPTGGTNTITASSLVRVLAGITSPGVTMSRTACPGTYTTTGGNIAATPTRISDYKLAFAIPSTVALATNGSGALTELSADYNVCLYTGTSGTDTLIAAPPTYTINPVLTLAASNTVSPSGGPAAGGSFVTITGSGFPYPATSDTVISASLGGSPIDQLRVTSSTTLTGYTTAHAPGAVTLSVTTASGTKTKGSAFTYSYGIQIAPTTAIPSASVTLDILGAGFSSLVFNATGNTSDAHVFLVNDTYDSTADSTTAANWANPPVTECTSIVPITDEEILCTLDLSKTMTAAGSLTSSPVARGTYTVIVVSDGSVGATLTQPQKSIISSGSTFTVADY